MEYKTTKLTLVSNGNTYSAELSWDAGLNDLFDAFKGLLVCATFHQESVENHILELAERLKNEGN